MNCRIYRGLFRLLPWAPLQGWLERHHLGSCPACAAEFGLSDAELKRLAPPVEWAGGVDLWTALRPRLEVQSRHQAGNLQRWLKLFGDLLLILGVLLAVVVLFFALAGME